MLWLNTKQACTSLTMTCSSSTFRLCWYLKWVFFWLLPPSQEASDVRFFPNSQHATLKFSLKITIILKLTNIVCFLQLFQYSISCFQFEWSNSDFHTVWLCQHFWKTMAFAILLESQESHWACNLYWRAQSTCALTFHWFYTLHAANGQSAAVPLIFYLLRICHSLQWTDTIQIQYVTTQHIPGFKLYKVACALSSWQFGTLFLDNMNTAVVMFCPRHCQSK